MPVETILRAILPPLVIAFVALAVAWWRGAARWGPVGSAAAIGVGVAAGAALMTRGWPGFPLTDADRWVGMVALLGAVAGLVWPRGRRRWWLVAAVAALALVCMAPLLWHELADGKRRAEGLLRLGIFGAVGTLLMLELRSVASAEPGARAPLALWASSTGLALVLMQSGVLTSAVLAGGMAVVMGWFVVLGLWRPAVPALPAAAPAAGLLLVSIYAGAYGYAPAMSMAAVLAAALTPWAARIGPLRRRPWLGTLVATVLSLVLVAVAISFTTHGFNFGPGEDDYGY